MTHLLEKAFAEASELPEKEQDAFAAFVLAELEAERRWTKAFERSQDELAQLGREALAKHRAGKTKRLNPDAL